MVLAGPWQWLGTLVLGVVLLASAIALIVSALKQERDVDESYENAIGPGSKVRVKVNRVYARTLDGSEFLKPGDVVEVARVDRKFCFPIEETLPVAWYGVKINGHCHEHYIPLSDVELVQNEVARPEIPAFWLVKAEPGGPPTFKHGSRESAVREAERLSRQNIGTRFFVLKTVESCVATLPALEWTQH